MDGERSADALEGSADNEGRAEHFARDKIGDLRRRRHPFARGTTGLQRL
jgi:hypothetical protein